MGWRQMSKSSERQAAPKQFNTVLKVELYLGQAPITAVGGGQGRRGHSTDVEVASRQSGRGADIEAGEGVAGETGTVA